MERRDMVWEEGECVTERGRVQSRVRAMAVVAQIRILCEKSKNFVLQAAQRAQRKKRYAVTGSIKSNNNNRGNNNYTGNYNNNKHEHHNQQKKIY